MEKRRSCLLQYNVLDMQQLLKGKWGLLFTLTKLKTIAQLANAKNNLLT